ncbi:hypothetical protein K7N18_11900 [Burkholderia arboris]|uniref:hypothetical protein n=2 Tax=Burkholderia TaxID=32008 RepID=UPI001CA39E8B|nr:hypothetical protein [Burkholderia arboris]MBY8605540.1 hypothetical protein [Burkholderia arboris]
MNVAAPGDDGNGSAGGFMEWASGFYRRRNAVSGAVFRYRFLPASGRTTALFTRAGPILAEIVFQADGE